MLHSSRNCRSCVCGAATRQLGPLLNCALRHGCWLAAKLQMMMVLPVQTNRASSYCLSRGSVAVLLKLSCFLFRSSSSSAKRKPGVESSSFHALPHPHPSPAHPHSPSAASLAAPSKHPLFKLPAAAALSPPSYRATRACANLLASKRTHINRLSSQPCDSTCPIQSAKTVGLFCRASCQNRENLFTATLTWCAPTLGGLSLPLPSPAHPGPGRRLLVLNLFEKEEA